MIKIITDSTCDLSPERQRTLGVEVVPLSVHFGEETFRDGIDLTFGDFYRKLEHADTLPTTSQVNPEEFSIQFRSHVENGDQVVGIFLSSLLSGTCQSALIARELVDEENIFVVDSGSASFALGLLVEQAARLRDEGLSPEELTAELKRLAGRLRFYVVVETLKYLRMGGRISSAAAVAGELLGINPILNIRDGVVQAAGKARGRKSAYQWMAARILEDPIDTSLPVAFGQADRPEVLKEIESFFSEKTPGIDIRESDMGAVVGTHTGPGCFGIAYFCTEAQ